MTTSNPPAVQLYTVREELAADRKDVLARLAAFGYGAVEAFNVLDDPAGLAADLAAAGLATCSVHATPTDGQAAAVVAAARALGTDTVIVPYLPPARFADAASVREVAAELNGMAARLASDGLRLGYHNHDFELSSLIGGRPALEVLAGVLDAGVLLEVDTYWAAVGGQDVPALLGLLGERVRYLHVKDGPVTRDDPMTAVGAGRDAGRGHPGRGPVRRVARGRAGPVRDRHDDRGRRQPGLAGRPRPGRPGGPHDGQGAGGRGRGRLRHHQRHVPGQPDLVPGRPRAVLRGSRPGPGPGPGGQVRGTGRGQHSAGRQPPRRRAGRQPHHPGRARRRGPARGGVRQKRVAREAARAGRERRAGAACGSRPGRGADRLRAGHRARRRAADGAPADQRGRHRGAADRAGPDAGPRPGTLAPGPGVPVPAGRGPAVRHRAVLPDHAGQPVRPGHVGGGARPAQPRPAGSSAAARGPAPGSRWTCPPMSPRCSATRAARPPPCC